MKEQITSLSAVVKRQDGDLKQNMQTMQKEHETAFDKLKHFISNFS
ncbi:MAG: hypothetical protein LBR26_03275 [Prevotella sp.]|nr:hypothetical protein [Prevotella sp.]